MDKKNIDKMMKEKSPIRETVKPVNFFNEEKVKPQTSKPENKQELIKYTTYLTEDEIFKIKLKALKEKKKDYGVLQEIIDKYFEELESNEELPTSQNDIKKEK